MPWVEMARQTRVLTFAIRAFKRIRDQVETTGSGASHPAEQPAIVARGASVSGKGGKAAPSAASKPAPGTSSGNLKQSGRSNDRFAMTFHHYSMEKTKTGTDLSPRFATATGVVLAFTSGSRMGANQTESSEPSAAVRARVAPRGTTKPATKAKAAPVSTAGQGRAPAASFKGERCLLMCNIHYAIEHIKARTSGQHNRAGSFFYGDKSLLPTDGAVRRAERGDGGDDGIDDTFAMSLEEAMDELESMGIEVGTTSAIRLLRALQTALYLQLFL